MKVSIIVPVYNVSTYIENCLSSIMNQTYKDIECLIVDDASTDDSITKCEKMIAEYEGDIHFIIIHHTKNQGISAARNTGLDASHGDYVYFIDSDDEISPNCIEALSSACIKDNTIEIVQGSYIKNTFDDNLNKKNVQNIKKREYEYYEFTRNREIRDHFFDGKGYLNIAAWNKLIKKEFLINHNLRFEEGLLWEDNMWSFFVMKYLKHLYLVPDITYSYNIRPKSIQTGTSKRAKRQIWGRIYKTIVDTPTPGDEVLEQLYYMPKFCYYYVTEYKDENYKYSYKAFEKTLSKSRANVSLRYLFLLKFARFMALTPPTRYLYVLIYYLYTKLI